MKKTLDPIKKKRPDGDKPSSQMSQEKTKIYPGGSGDPAGARQEIMKPVKPQITNKNLPIL